VRIVVQVGIAAQAFDVEEQIPAFVVGHLGDGDLAMSAPELASFTTRRSSATIGGRANSARFMIGSASIDSRLPRSRPVVEVLRRYSNRGDLVKSVQEVLRRAREGTERMSQAFVRPAARRLCESGSPKRTGKIGRTQDIAHLVDPEIN
jgi:hypothetical protein